MKKIIKAAWPHTIPVMAGYIFLGIAFGFLVKTKGYPLWYPILMSTIIYSGALEFAVIPLMAEPLDIVGSFFMALMISARHLFYGLSMLDKYDKTGKLKFPLIYTLTDETFSLLSTIEVPEGMEKSKFYAAISFFDYSYWTIGTILGAAFGQFLPIDTTGIDFALTALFLVLFLEQVKTREGKISGFLGLLSTFVVLLFFGSENMVVIAMAVIFVLLWAGRKGIEHE